MHLVHATLEFGLALRRAPPRTVAPFVGLVGDQLPVGALTRASQPSDDAKRFKQRKEFALA